MRVGIVCPYSLDVPGGVQSHVLDLARALRRVGHEVDVLAPADEDADVPEFVTPAGRALGIPYNGSVARLSFGPVSFSRVRRWIREHDFDVLHLHEPTAPSLSMLALMLADGPIVATFHTSTPRSRALTAFQAVLQPFLEKITARIAVSVLARRVQVEHLGGDAVEIANGVDAAFYSGAVPLEGYPRAGGTVGFVGRFGEPRKGMSVLLGALPRLVAEFPDFQLLVVGPGEQSELADLVGPRFLRHVRFLGRVDDPTKARLFHSVDVYCAPNTGRESFGMILTEAMAAGAAVAASGIDAFRRVLDDGRAGVLFPVGEEAGLAEAVAGLLRDEPGRRAIAEAGRRRVAAFDWPVIAGQVLRVYETAIAAAPGRVHEAADTSGAAGGVDR